MANRYYNNTDGDFDDTASWGTVSGGAGASIPGASDVIRFDSNSGTLTLNVPISVQGIVLEASYASTIYQGANTINFGSAHFTVDGGTFIGGTADILGTNTNRFQQTGGVFTSTSGTFKVGALGTVPYAWDVTGGVFNHNGGRVEISGSNHARARNLPDYPLNALTISLCPTCSTGGELYVDGDVLHIQSSSSQGIQLYLNGNFETQGRGGVRLIYEGNGHQTFITNDISNRIGSFTINKPAGTLEFLSDIAWNGSWVHTQGDILWNNHNAICGTTQNGHSIVNGYFWNLVRETTAGVGMGTSGNTIQCENNFTLGSTTTTGNFPTVQLKGTLIVLTIHGSCTEIIFNGDALSQQIQNTSPTLRTQLTINKPQGSVDLTADLELLDAANDLNIISGELNQNEFQLVIADMLNQLGGVYNQGAGVLSVTRFNQLDGIFNEGESGIYCVGSTFTIGVGAIFNRHRLGGLFATSGASALTININGNILNRLIFSRGAANLVLASSFAVQKAYIFTGTGFHTGLHTISLYSNITFDGLTTTAACATLQFASSSDQVISSNNSTINSGKIIVDKPSGVLIQEANLNIASGTNTNKFMQLIKGVFCTNQHNLTCVDGITVDPFTYLERTPDSVITSSVTGEITEVTRVNARKLSIGSAL